MTTKFAKQICVPDEKGCDASTQSFSVGLRNEVEQVIRKKSSHCVTMIFFDTPNEAENSFREPTQIGLEPRTDRL